MAVLQFKRRASGAAGAPASLKSGEPAFNMADHTLYLGFGDDGNGNATSIIAIAGKGAFADLTSDQTIGGNKTFSASPVAPTPVSSDNSTKVATTAFVKGQGFLTTANKITDLTAPTTAPAFNSQRLTGVADPTQATDAATKSYVDNLVQGLAWKTPVRACAASSITLSGQQTIDGVALAVGDRVLCTGQTGTPETNGIWLCQTGAWTRPADFDVSAEAVPSTTMLVQEGGVYGDKAFTLATNAPITLGTTPLAFVQITGGATGEANTASSVGANGIGIVDGKTGVDLQFRKLYAPNTQPITLTLTGQEIDIGFATDTSLEVNSGNLRIKTTWAGQTAITTLGTITTGIWNASIIAGTYGGTGVNLGTLANGALLKNSSGSVAAAVAGTDYLAPGSTIDCGSF